MRAEELSLRRVGASGRSEAREVAGGRTRRSLVSQNSSQNLRLAIDVDVGQVGGERLAL